MTTEKLYETLSLIDSLDSEFTLQTILTQISTSLVNIANAPAEPTYQAALATSLSKLSSSVIGFSEAITPAQLDDIGQLGGKKFFDPNLAEFVQQTVSANAMTPSVARDSILTLTTHRAEFLKTIRDIQSGLDTLGISGTELPPGAADLFFLVPRDLFKNNLQLLAKELSFINRLIEHFAEATTGKTVDVQLESLASSDPTIFLVTAPEVIAKLADAVDKFLNVWERVKKMRKVRDEVAELGMKGTALDEMSEQITTTVEEVVEETTRITLQNFNGDSTRHRELETAIKNDTRRLYGQIERGLSVHFRANPKDEDENTLASLEKINTIAHRLHYPAPAKEPLLLAESQILDGENSSVQFLSVKKTTRTTTEKRQK